jgi:hypothetical protein
VAGFFLATILVLTYVLRAIIKGEGPFICSVFDAGAYLIGGFLVILLGGLVGEVIQITLGFLLSVLVGIRHRQAYLRAEELTRQAKELTLKLGPVSSPSEKLQRERMSQSEGMRKEFGNASSSD